MFALMLTPSLCWCWSNVSSSVGPMLASVEVNAGVVLFQASDCRCCHQNVDDLHLDWRETQSWGIRTTGTFKIHCKPLMILSYVLKNRNSMQTLGKKQLETVTVSAHSAKAVAWRLSPKMYHRLNTLLWLLTRKSCFGNVRPCRKLRNGGSVLRSLYYKWVKIIRKEITYKTLDESIN